ncbi:MAG TPA: DUF1326 domain-containing protein [Chthoniobacterales bacterium]|nr:DUF1326 domain-containing protein [Chthoniobacterales bacterium]
MKSTRALLVAFLGAASVATAAKVPSGSVVEVHAVEVYTGGCTASAQATSGGRSMLRLWSFEDGEQDGVELRGLQVAALQAADQNLASAETQPTSAVVYLPRTASAAQRAALVMWLKAANPEMADTPVAEKIAEINYKQSGTRIELKIDKQIAMTTREIQKCDTGACGESLWYKPRTKIGDYTVLVNESSTVEEPALSLVWKDNSAKSVFFGNFGADAQPQFRLAWIE